MACSSRYSSHLFVKLDAVQVCHLVSSHLIASHLISSHLDSPSRHSNAICAYHEAFTAMEQLNEEADRCLAELREISERAAKAHRTHRTASTTNLLKNVERRSENSSRLLQTWKTDLGKGKITDDRQSVSTTVDRLVILHHWIETACDALALRLVFRRLFLIGFIPSTRSAQPFFHLDNA